MHREKIIEAYIERLLLLQDQRERPLTESDLHGIAHDLGFGPEEQAEIRREFEARLKRGTGYGQHGRWEDAIGEIKDALALNPISAKAAQELAHVYLQRWIANARNEDKQQAEYHAKYTLKLDPQNKRAFEALSEIERRYISVPDLNEPNAEHNRAMYITLAVSAAVVIALLLAVFL